MLGFRKKEQAAAVSVQTRPEESFRLLFRDGREWRPLVPEL